MRCNRCGFEGSAPALMVHACVGAYTEAATEAFTETMQQADAALDADLREVEYVAKQIEDVLDPILLNTNIKTHILVAALERVAANLQKE